MPMTTRERKLQDAMKEIIAAWDELKGGAEYQPAEVEPWLNNRLGPAIKRAREAIRS